MKAAARLAVRPNSSALTAPRRSSAAPGNGRLSLDLRYRDKAVTLEEPMAEFVLVPDQGLVGLARAQVLQSLLLCVAGWVVLRRLFAPLPFVEKQGKDVGAGKVDPSHLAEPEEVPLAGDSKNLFTIADAPRASSRQARPRPSARLR